MPECVLIADGAEGLFVKNTRFKTARISFNFYLPLSQETVATNALLPCLLTSCSEKYPTFLSLNRKLKSMYGAVLFQSSSKFADLQCITLGITVLCDKYTPDNSPVVSDAAQLLAELVFSPRLEGEAFFDADVKREKRQLAERIRGELNNKRLYARNRMTEEMYEGLPFGLNRCGTAEDVEKVSGEDLFLAWQNILRSAYLRINVIGDIEPEPIFSAAGAAFCAIQRENITDVYALCGTKPRAQVKRITEKMDVAQGKLVMGFDSEMFGSNEDSDALTVAADIFGGGPYSLLFENVREKQSLCYYCACAAVRLKGLVTVDCGIEAANAQKAESEILKQLVVLKQDEFDGGVFDASVCNIKDTFRSVNDSQATLDLWFAARVNQKNPATPEDMALRIEKVTREQVNKAAQGINLNTVYLLLPQKSAAESEER